MFSSRLISHFVRRDHLFSANMRLGGRPCIHAFLSILLLLCAKWAKWGTLFHISITIVVRLFISTRKMRGVQHIISFVREMGTLFHISITIVGTFVPSIRKMRAFIILSVSAILEAFHFRDSFDLVYHPAFSPVGILHANHKPLGKLEVQSS